MAADNFKTISVTAVMVVGGTQYELSAATVTTTYTGVPVANVVLATGYAADGKLIMSSLAALLDGADAKIEVEVLAGSDFVGLPKGKFTAFRGYVGSVGPSISGEAGSNVGVQLVHSDMSSLMSGSTVQWGPMLAGNQLDPAGYIRNALGAPTGGTYSSKGVFAVLTDVFTQLMKSSFLGAGATMMKCAQAANLNKEALAALGRIKGSKLPLRSQLASSTAMYNFITSRLTEIRAMSIYEQIRALGTDLMFELVPSVTGGVTIVPAAVFVKKAFATIRADDIFDFSPEFSPNRSIAGVVLVSNQPNGGQAMTGGSSGVAGCYVFPQSIVRAGILTSMPVPQWMSPGLATFWRDGSRPPLQTPAVVGSPIQPVATDAAVTAGKANEESVKTYGDGFARELARRQRYANSRATFTTYLRTDIGPMSTIAVNAPVGVTEDVSIYGLVEAVTLRIADGTATATFTLSHVRSREIQDQILADGGGTHPLYSDEPWIGGPI